MRPEKPENKQFRADMIIKFHLQKSQIGWCPLCALDFHPTEEINILSCHPKHVMHTACYETFKKFHKENNIAITCPICRAPIDEQKATVTLVEPNQVDLIAPSAVQDQFGLPTANSPDVNSSSGKKLTQNELELVQVQQPAQSTQVNYVFEEVPSLHSVRDEPRVQPVMPLSKNFDQ